MKTIITGCNGLLGQNLVASYKNKEKISGIDIADRKFVDNKKFTYFKCDITDRNALRDTIVELEPEWIIHTAGYTNVDGAETEKELCWNVNVTGAENIAYAARKARAKIIHISTDYIFDGKDGPYTEDFRPNPLGYYARSKLAAENIIRGSELDHTIVRIMVLYGYGRNLRDNFVTWLIKKLKKNESVNIVDDQIGNTTFAEELAQSIWKIVEKNKFGVYNIAGSEIIDRYSFALKVAEVFKLKKDLINPIKTEMLAQPAPRPLNSGLIIDKAKEELGIRMSDAEGGLQKFKQQLRKQNSDLI